MDSRIRRFPGIVRPSSPKETHEPQAPSLSEVTKAIETLKEFEQPTQLYGDDKRLRLAAAKEGRLFPSMSRQLELLTFVFTRERALRSDVDALRNALRLLKDVQALSDPKVLKHVHPTARPNFPEKLFEPLDVLIRAAESYAARLSRRPTDVLNNPVDIFYTVQPKELLGDAVDRFAVNDRIAVRRTGGTPVLAVVTELNDDGGAQVEFRLDADHVGTRQVTWEEIEHQNPLKIGDHLSYELPNELWEGGTPQQVEVFVTGVGRDGRVCGEMFTDGVPTKLLDGDGLAKIAMYYRNALLTPTEPSRPEVPVEAPPLVAPVEVPPQVASVSRPPPVTEPTAVEVSGGRSIDEPLVVHGAKGSVAVYSNKGVNYPNENEDAAVGSIFPERDGASEAALIGVSDEAGGHRFEGQGQVSATVARHVREAAHSIWKNVLSPKEALTKACLDAHKELREINSKNNTNGVTTGVYALLRDGKMRVVNVGDSFGILYRQDGTFAEKTKPHTIRVMGRDWLSYAIGQREPLKAEHVDPYEWDTKPGDWAVMISDGAADAFKNSDKDVFDEIGKCLRRATSPEEATRLIRDFVLKNMEDGTGKPDNVSIVVYQVATSSP